MCLSNRNRLISVQQNSDWNLQIITKLYYSTPPSPPLLPWALLRVCDCHVSASLSRLSVSPCLSLSVCLSLRLTASASTQRRCYHQWHLSLNDTRTPMWTPVYIIMRIHSVHILSDAHRPWFRGRLYQHLVNKHDPSPRISVAPVAMTSASIYSLLFFFFSSAPNQLCIWSRQA